MELLILSAAVGSIVLPAPRIATLATMVLPAAKRTAEILPASVAGMSKETNPAVATPNCAALQVRTNPQRGVHCQVILPNKRFDAVVSVPIFAK